MSILERAGIRVNATWLLLTLFGIVAVISLFLITLTVQPHLHATRNELERVRAMWPLTPYFIGLSLAIRALTLHVMKWGEIKQCLSGSFMMHSPSLLMLPILFLIFMKRGFEIREFLGGFLWWQNLYLISLVALSITIEGFLLYVVNSLGKRDRYRKPWRAAIYANLIDAGVRLCYFIILQNVLG